MCQKVFGSKTHRIRHEKNLHQHFEPDTTAISSTTSHKRVSVQKRKLSKRNIKKGATSYKTQVRDLDCEPVEGQETGKGVISRNIIVEEINIKDEVTLENSSEILFKVETASEETNRFVTISTAESIPEVEHILPDTTVNHESAQQIPNLYCPYCYLRFPSNTELEDHALTSHSDPSTVNSRSHQFKCPHLYCLENFESVKSLKIHQRDYHKLKDT